MISDKELELLDKKPLLGAAVTGPAVRLGRTQTANPATLAVFADGLTGGTATTVTVETAEDEAFPALDLKARHAPTCGKRAQQEKPPAGGNS